MITIYEGEKEEVIKPDIAAPAAQLPKQPEPKPEEDELFSAYIADFLHDFEAKLKNNEADGGPTIKVSEVLGGIARLYERIRTTIEYKGEHVLRRSAIERILKRLVWEKESVRANIDNSRVAEMLLKEMIWARYLKNSQVLQHKKLEVEKIVDKYVYFLKSLDNLPKGVSASTIRSWIWGVASSEIEDVLEPTYRELFVRLMYNWFRESFNWADSNWNDHDKEVQIYLAIHRSVTKSDEPIIRYHLLLKEYPNWNGADKTEINNLILKFPEVYREIEDHLNFPRRFALYRRVQKHSAALEVFREIALSQKAGLREILKDKTKFEVEVRTVCERKYRHIREKVRTGIVRSVIYIFLTKMVFALLIEIPYEVIRFDEVRYIPLAINMIFPPILMFIIGLSIKTPGARNTEGILGRLNSVIYKSASKEAMPFSIVKNNGNSTLALVFGVLYSLLFVLVFGGVTYLLTLLNFSIFGLLVFFVFISLVILFAFRVRYNATQLKIESDAEGLFGHFSSYLTLPFLYVGSYLSQGLAKINFFAVIFDFLIEVPLKNVIEIFEEWTSFLREKKEEVVEMPE